MKFLWLFVIAGTLFISCGGEEEVAGSECITKEDCTTPLICINGFCKAEDNGDAECTTSQECPFGEECIDFKCVEISGDTTGDTAGDTAGDTSGDTGDSADTGNTADTADSSDTTDTTDSADSSDSGDSADTTPDTADTATDNTIIPDEESDEIPDEDVDSGEIDCGSTGECSEDMVCVATKCRNPFDFKWRIGDISLTTSDDDWDPFGNDPDPYVQFMLNGTLKFETDYADDDCNGNYSESYETYLIPTDSMTFLVIDYDGGLNLSDNDLMETFQLNSVDPKWLHDGKYSLTPTENVPKFIVYFDIIL